MSGWEEVTLTSADIHRWLEAFAAAIASNRDYLTELDSAIGDADHGINMDRGFTAVLEKIGDVPDDIGAILKAVGMTLISKVGGASGPLYGTFFLDMATRTAGHNQISASEWVEALSSGVDGVIRRGKAERGDKTMVDVWLPVVDSLRAGVANGQDFTATMNTAGQVAETSMRETIPLVARKGRASYLGERSAGHQDPGATSSYLLIKAAVDTFT